MQKWLITGANGNLGKRLIAQLLAVSSNEVVAVVRSQRAVQAIQAANLSEEQLVRLDIKVVDYQDVEALTVAAEGCQRAVHLVGILKATKQATYFDAHEGSCKALTQALAASSVKHLTYLSIVGSSVDANNTCLASKGRAEQICLDAPMPACVLRVPMVLGEGDYASAALKRRAASGRSFTFRASSKEQPIYAGDVVGAIIAASGLKIADAIDLGGPEILSRRQLTQRAGDILTRQTNVVSLPLPLGKAMAWLMEMFMPNPPMTRAMLGVLDHDDEIDPKPAMEVLGLSSLTPLDDMLKAVLI